MGNVKTKAYFVHIPKTAGNSVRHRFKHVLTNPGNSKSERVHHFAVDDAARYGHASFTTKYFPNYVRTKEYQAALLSFTVIRNPFSMLYSYYMHDAHGTNKDDGWANVNSVHGIKSFEEFVIRYCTDDPDEWHVPDLSRCLYAQLFNAQGNSCVQYAIKFEQLNDGAKQIFKLLRKKKRGEVPYLNVTTRSKKKKYRDEYTSEMIDLVTKKCAWELETFGYKFKKTKSKYDALIDIRDLQHKIR